MQCIFCMCHIQGLKHFLLAFPFTSTVSELILLRHCLAPVHRPGACDVQQPKLLRASARVGGLEERGGEEDAAPV